MPIGGVAAYSDRVSVVGVGFDIACGNAAIRTDKTLADLGDDAEAQRRALTALGDEIAATVSFGIGRKARADDAPLAHPLFEAPAWEAAPPQHRQALSEKARLQLGTVGSGNHYVDVFADEGGTLWIGVHFGSRGFGHTVASAVLALSQGRAWGGRGPGREALLDLAGPRGHDHWPLMTLGGRGASAGRGGGAAERAAPLCARDAGGVGAARRAPVGGRGGWREPACVRGVARRAGRGGGKGRGFA